MREHLRVPSRSQGGLEGCIVITRRYGLGIKAWYPQSSPEKIKAKIHSSNVEMNQRAFHGSGHFSRVGSGSSQDDPARPARFEYLLTRPDPTREIMKSS